MKKIILLTISILMVTAVFAKIKAGNPIPSFNVPVADRAYFQEINVAITNFLPSDEKRDMNISNDSPGYRPGSIGSGSIQVIIYRLDQAVVLGPFVIAAGQTLTVPIDGNRWGVAAQTAEPTFMSVWTSAGQQP